MMKYFVFVIIRRLPAEGKYTGIPNIRFVFNQQTITYLEKMMQTNFQDGRYCINTNLVENTEYLENDEFEEVIHSLRQNNIDYQKYLTSERVPKEKEIFLPIRDAFSFFQLLTDIVNDLRKEFGFNREEEDNLLSSLWLRMGPRDLQNIQGFLKRELSFLKHHLEKDVDCFDTNIISSDDQIYYQIQRNGMGFETNLNIVFYLVHGNEYYYFPMIHYGISEEDGQRVCYIYAIQDSKKLVKSDIIERKLQSIKKNWRNKYVKPTFVLSLSFFITLLKENKIDKIKVPLLQVLNYDYHCNLSKIMEESFMVKYPSMKQNIIERCLKENLSSPILSEYQEEKERMLHFVHQEDLISKNKTERLIETFLVLEDKENNLERLNDPFIEDEYLNIKIKRKD